MTTRLRAYLTLALTVALVGARGLDVPPVVDAAKQRDWEVVRRLVSEHADVNATAPDGSSALHWASYWDEVDVADLLIRAGADANAANDLGATPALEREHERERGDGADTPARRS